MLAEPIADPEATTPTELLERYESALADVVDSRGTDAVAEATDLDAETVDAVAAGDAGDLDLRDAATILALRDGSPDADALLTEVRDHLLLSMSSAVLTVDHVAADVEGDMDPKEIQGKVEGRHPMTLAEYARIHHYVASAA